MFPIIGDVICNSFECSSFSRENIHLFIVIIIASVHFNYVFARIRYRTPTHSEYDLSDFIVKDFHWKWFWVIGARVNPFIHKMCALWYPFPTNEPFCRLKLRVFYIKFHYNVQCAQCHCHLNLLFFINCFYEIKRHYFGAS